MAQRGGGKDGQMNRKYPHATGLRPLLEPLPKNKAIYTTVSGAGAGAGAGIQVILDI